MSAWIGSLRGVGKGISVRLLFFGDVVGRSGREVVRNHVPGLRGDLNIDFVIVNGENAAGGFGITRKICDEFFEAGIDVITTGNHVWDQREVFTFIDNEDRLCGRAITRRERRVEGWGCTIFRETERSW